MLSIEWVSDFEIDEYSSARNVMKMTRFRHKLTHGNDFQAF